MVLGSETAPVKLLGVRTVHHLPAETEPRILGRDAKGTKEPEASTGWGPSCGQATV